MEKSYSDFARVYDEFMDNVDYEEWAGFIIGCLRQHGIQGGLVLDLGCGTGTMTGLLAGAGYDMIGVDESEQMLSQAMEKRQASGYDILYLCQRMQSFELYGTVRAVVSVCDCLNYILDEEELGTVFSLVNNYLDPGGLFIFDLNTEHLYRDEIGDTTIAENREDSSFIWDNEYDDETCTNTYLLTLFLKTRDNLYEKREELHVQKAYSLDTVKRQIKQAGMKLLAVYDGYTLNEPSEDSTRWTFVAMEQGKTRT